MAQRIEAIYEKGVFLPLQPVGLEEGQRVALDIEPIRLTPAEAEDLLRAWHKVYEGLFEEDIADIEESALDRNHFIGSRNDGDE